MFAETLFAISHDELVEWFLYIIWNETKENAKASKTLRKVGPFILVGPRILFEKTIESTELQNKKRMNKWMKCQQWNNFHITQCLSENAFVAC